MIYLYIYVICIYLHLHLYLKNVLPKNSITNIDKSVRGRKKGTIPKNPLEAPRDDQHAHHIVRDPVHGGHYTGTGLSFSLWNFWPPWSSHGFDVSLGTLVPQSLHPASSSNLCWQSLCWAIRSVYTCLVFQRLSWRNTETHNGLTAKGAIAHSCWSVCLSQWVAAAHTCFFLQLYHMCDGLTWYYWFRGHQFREYRGSLSIPIVGAHFC